MDNHIPKSAPSMTNELMRIRSLKKRPVETEATICIDYRRIVSTIVLKYLIINTTIF